ncbi:MAG TPA: hypothetical protein VIO62_09710 [Candidatus Dormibacteraeota bacterium]|jgi:hypothetical protein
MTQVGTSFVRWRAEDLGLEYRDAFTRVCAMGFDLIRLSTSWREVDEAGHRHLDWLMAEAERVEQRVLLTVGMKALGWPEFHLPQARRPGDVGIRRGLLDHVAATVRRYRGCRQLLAWQIENEPFNRSGPLGGLVPRSLVRAEAACVRGLDPTRPIVITTFGHFDAGLDRWSSRWQSTWRRRLRLEIPGEREALAVLQADDVLGLDVYRAIGWRRDGVEGIAHAVPDQMDSVARWNRIARGQHKRLWITEAQAEPWEASRATHGDPVSVQPNDVLELYERLSSLSLEAILLWGVEYWLWRERHGDPRWSNVARRILERRLIS